MAKTNQQIIDAANVIKNETVPLNNTAERIGTQFLDQQTFVKEEVIDKIVTDFSGGDGKFAGAVETQELYNSKLNKQLGSNLLDPSQFRYGSFYLAGQSHEIATGNNDYGVTDYIPVSESGLVTSGAGRTSDGLSSYAVFDSSKKWLRNGQDTDQYTYVDGDAYVVFCYYTAGAQGFADTVAVIEGEVYEFEKYTDYAPVEEIFKSLDTLLFLQKNKIDKQLGSNLLDPSQFRYGSFYLAGQSHEIATGNNDYGVTDYIPVSVNGLITSGAGKAAEGLSSYAVFNASKDWLRNGQNSDQYTYVAGDAYVVFCFYIMENLAFAESVAVVEGTQYFFEKYTDYANVSEIQKILDIDEDKEDINTITPDCIYTTCNDINTNRNYANKVWLDHLIYDTDWRNKSIGFSKSLEKYFNVISPITFNLINGGANVYTAPIEKTIISMCNLNPKNISILHRSTKSSITHSSFPKILVIGDSVTDGYLAGFNKSDVNLPNQYWSWVKYFFELDRIDSGGSQNDHNCLLIGMPYPYGSIDSFLINSNTFTNYAVGKGGWSAEDLNLPYFETQGNINPFYNSETQKFSISTFLSKYKTLANDGKTRLAVGVTAGTEVTDATAWDVCEPTHVIINLNHNSSLKEYQDNIPQIINTIRTELPNAYIGLMVIDEVGTYFTNDYPAYKSEDVSLGYLHNKNATIYNYIKTTLLNENDKVFVVSGNLVQHPVQSYPSLEYVSADSLGKNSVDIVNGTSPGGGPSWHPNNHAHSAWGYQLYSFIKYTLAL